MNPWPVIMHELEQNDRVGVVTISNVKGSAPREVGAMMVVSKGQLACGTIGGGALEFDAIKTVRKMLTENTSYLSQQQEIILGPQLQQCCGGVVALKFEVFTQNEMPLLRQKADIFQANNPLQNLLLFGAGHVGKALVAALTELPFSIKWFDNRVGIFPDQLPQYCETRQWESSDKVFVNQPEKSIAIVMTHSHEVDFEVTKAALLSPNISFAGLIGSATKKARFIKRFEQAGLGREQIEQLNCPVGIDGISSKHPAAIAASITARLLIETELVKKGRNTVRFAQKTA